MNKKCIICGKEVPNYQKYCSKKCYNISQKKGFYKICEVCKKESYVKHSRANENVRFCSRKCMGISFRNKIETECSYCGNMLQVEPNRIRKYNFCDNKCKKLYRQVGCGITTDGYVWIIVDGYNRHNQVKIHRYLMEVKLGRKLKSTEIVHHKDFNKLNNNINNLEILTREEHNKIHNFLKR